MVTSRRAAANSQCEMNPDHTAESDYFMPLNDRLDAYTNEYGELDYPHLDATAKAIAPLSQFPRSQEDRVAKELLFLLQSDPSFAYNFARFCNVALEKPLCMYQKPRPLTDVNSPQAADQLTAARLPITFADIFRTGSIDPFLVVTQFTTTNTFNTVFIGEFKNVAPVYRQISKVILTLAKRVAAEVPPEQQLIAYYMVLNSAAPILTIASMSPEVARPILVAGANVNAVSKEILGFEPAELQPYIDQIYAMPRNNNPAYPAKTRALARAAQHEFLSSMKFPQAKAA